MPSRPGRSALCRAFDPWCSRRGDAGGRDSRRLSTRRSRDCRRTIGSQRKPKTVWARTARKKSSQPDGALRPAVGLAALERQRGSRPVRLAPGRRRSSVKRFFATASTPARPAAYTGCSALSSLASALSMKFTTPASSAPGSSSVGMMRAADRLDELPLRRLVKTTGSVESAAAASARGRGTFERGPKRTAVERALQQEVATGDGSSSWSCRLRGSAVWLRR